MHDDEFLPPSSDRLSLSAGTASGLAGLVIGCTLFISACALMAFNMLLFMHGIRGFPHDLAKFGGAVGAVGGTGFGVFALVIGLGGWRTAKRNGESAMLAIAGSIASFCGLVAWIIAGIVLLAVLRVL